MSQTVGFHLSELVAALGGEWRGEDVQIKAVAPLETAGDGDIAFSGQSQISPAIGRLSRCSGDCASRIGRAGA